MLIMKKIVQSTKLPGKYYENHMEDCAEEVYKDLRFYFNKKVPFSLLSDTIDIIQTRKDKAELN